MHKKANANGFGGVKGGGFPSTRFISRRAGLLFWSASIACCLAIFSGCEKKEEAPPPAPPEVSVTEVVQQDVPIYSELVSQLNGPVNAEITPKVQGYLLKQVYQNGYFVKKGQLLFELDPRQYQAGLDEAKAQLSASQANLARIDADVARDTPLAAQQAIPQKDLDTDLANQKAMRSEVEAKKAYVMNAELNLGWTKIYSPIDGIAGASSAQVGDLVGPNTKMVTVSQVNPIWAYFSVSEAEFLREAPILTKVISGQVSRASVKTSPVEFITADDVPFPHKGTIIYVNREIGTQTGTIQVAAEFPNPQAVLRPGGFGRVRVKAGDNKNALLVPQAAVIEIQGQYQIIVLTAENRAVFRPIKVGERVGVNWIVSDGLKPGERVVVDGIQKIQTIAGQAPDLAKQGVPVSPKPYASAATGGGN